MMTHSTYQQIIAVRRACHLVHMNTQGQCSPGDYARLMAGLATEFPELPEIEAMRRGEAGAQEALLARRKSLERVPAE